MADVFSNLKGILGTDFFLNKGTVALVELTVDPSVSGKAAPIGSIGLRDNSGVGELWLKIGAADTAWTQLSALSGAATTLTAWTLISGNDYFSDFSHNLGSSDIVVSVVNTVNNKEVEVEELERTDDNTLRVQVKGNTHSLRVSVISATANVGTNIAFRFKTDVKASGEGGTFTWTGAGPFLVTIPFATHGIPATIGFEPVVQFRDDDGTFFHGVGAADYKFNTSGDLFIEMPTDDDLRVVIL